MYDILPFPNITATDTKEQVAQINNYLIQFKETLEFALANISVDNLSVDLKNRLNELGADIKTSNDEREEQIQRISQNALTVSDVVNSPAFEAFAEGVETNTRDMIEDLNFIASGEQTQTSVESGGLNVFTFTDSKGDTYAFEVRNGEKGDTPTVTLEIDYETGELLYTTN